MKRGLDATSICAKLTQIMEAKRRSSMKAPAAQNAKNFRTEACVLFEPMKAR